MKDFTSDGPGAPKIVDRSTFEAELDALRVREKAHTREGDAIAAARRRLPMVEEIRSKITRCSARDRQKGTGGNTTIVPILVGPGKPLEVAPNMQPRPTGARPVRGQPFVVSG
jgi:hypothetical protein